MSDRFRKLMERRAHKRYCRCCNGSKIFRTKNVRTEFKRELQKEINEELWMNKQENKSICEIK